MKQWMGLGGMVALLTGCATAAQPRFLVTPDRQPEARTLPPDPATEPLPQGVPATSDFVEPSEPGSCLDAQGRPVMDAPRPCPNRAGILVGETRAARDGLFRLRYRELRVLYDADRQVWQAQRALYEGQLQRADEHIQSLRPNWWQQNALGLGIGGGFLLGTVTVISVLAVTNQIQRPATTTSP
jgi:hypothetical protein